MAFMCKLQAEDVSFVEQRGNCNRHSINFVELNSAALFARVHSAHGLLQTPKLNYDVGIGQRPSFFNFAYGASCSSFSLTLSGSNYS